MKNRTGLFTLPTGAARPRPLYFANPPPVSPGPVSLEGAPAPLGRCQWVAVGVRVHPEAVPRTTDALNSILRELFTRDAPGARLEGYALGDSTRAEGWYPAPEDLQVDYWVQGERGFGEDPEALRWLAETVARALPGR